MSTTITFQYSILRYFHDFSTGEFLNIGLVFYNKDANLLKSRLSTRYGRISNTFPGFNGQYYQKYMRFVEGALVKLEKQFKLEPQRLMRTGFPENIQNVLSDVLPIDDASIKFSKVLEGISSDIDSTFEQMYSHLIERYLEPTDRSGRDDLQVWQKYRNTFENYTFLHRLSPYVVDAKVDRIEFDHAWKNGHWNALQPISFDLKVPGSIRNKAKIWHTNEHLIDQANGLSNLYILLGEPRTDDRMIIKAFGDAKDILHKDFSDLRVTLISEDEAEDFAAEINQKIQD